MELKKDKNKRVYEMQINEQDPESGVFALSLVEYPAIESNFTYLSAVKELIELKTINEEKRLVVGPALIPNKEILRTDELGEDYYILFSNDTVQKASQLYLKRMNQWNTTLEHEVALSGVALVESWIVEDPKIDKSKALGLDVPKGTWMIAMSIEDNEVWNQYVKTGKVKGISLEGLFEHTKLSKTKSKEDLLLEEVTSLLKAYLETSTNISSTYAGEPATSGSIITDAK